MGEGAGLFHSGSHDNSGRRGGVGVGSFEPTPAISHLAVGKIERVIGTATVTRSERNFLKSGDPVFQGDIIETTAGGEVDICFADGTTFRLSNRAQMALKEFPNAETARPALFDIACGDFAFIAGEKAKTDRFEIETPFARIRGRTRVGGIGTLSLISLFFATMEELQAAPSDAASTDDGTHNPGL